MFKVLRLTIAACAILSLKSCTLSFTNLSTNGKASDVVDEEQAASPQITSTVTIPVSPL